MSWRRAYVTRLARQRLHQLLIDDANAEVGSDELRVVQALPQWPDRNDVAVKLVESTEIIECR